MGCVWIWVNVWNLTVCEEEEDGRWWSYWELGNVTVFGV